MRKRFPEKGIQVRVPDDILLIPMDATLIEQVLINLVENAFSMRTPRRLLRLQYATWAEMLPLKYATTAPTLIPCALTRF